MFITVLPKADPNYTCKPKLDNTTALPALGKIELTPPHWVFKDFDFSSIFFFYFSPS